MAAPTNVRVWAIGQTSTILKWSYSGSHSIGIYISTDGASYSLTDSVEAATLTYNDIGLIAGTKYWYKLSDDGGSTFSSVVTVKSHACGDDGKKKRRGFALPRSRRRGNEEATRDIGIGRRSGDKDIPIGRRNFDKAMRDIEEVVEKRILHAEPCVVCVTDGAIVIDCADDCECYDVDVDADINSITFLNCDGVDPCINFRVPPSTTRGICGFPQGHDGFATQFTGDECFSNPISGGTNGRTVTTGKQKPRSKPGSGKASGGGGGSGCECIPGSNGQLTIKCCSAECSMSCSSSKSLQIKICGGSPPYSISGSAGLTFTKQGGTTVSSDIPANSTVIIRPPTNSGSGEAGTAYTAVGQYCTNTLNKLACTDYGCNDQVLVYATPTNTPGANCNCAEVFEDGSPCNDGTSSTDCIGGACGGRPAWFPSEPTVGQATKVDACDRRTAPMIAAGCNPCGVAAQDKTFTVTDAQGVSVVTTLTV